jgi:hypothetical protein
MVWPDGDRLRYRAPRGVVTPELRERLRTHRDELRELLSRDQEPDLVEGDVAERLAACAWRLRSRLLDGEEIWLAKDDQIAAGLAAEFPGVAVFTLAEIPGLASKPAALVKAIVKVKKAFPGADSRLVQ